MLYSYLWGITLDALNRIVSAYLEFAEMQAMNRRPMSMANWVAKLDDFLRLSDRGILTHAGRISHEEAEEARREETAEGISSQGNNRFHLERLRQLGVIDKEGYGKGAKWSLRNA